MAMQTFTPLADYLSKKLGRPVNLESAPNFQSFWAGVKERRYDLVHFNQYHYVRAHKFYAYDVIAKNEERGSSTISGALIVRVDRGINQVSDLKGRKILFGGGRMAMQSYIVASYLLQQAGLKRGDYLEEFASSPATAILSAHFGTASAAGSADINLHSPVIMDRIDTRKMKVLAKYKPMAHLPWAVKREMPEVLRDQLRGEMVDLVNSEEGRRVLHTAELTALRSANDEDFDEHRKIIETVLGEKY